MPVLTLTPVADGYFDNQHTTTNYGSDTVLKIGAGGPDGAGNIYHAWFKFDLSLLPPTGSVTLNSLTLTLKNALLGTSPSLANNVLCRSIINGNVSQWNAVTELGSTWLTYDGVNNWTTAGGNNVIGAQISIAMGSGSADLVFTTSSATLLTNAQASTPGYLILLVRKNTEATAGDYVGVHSRQAASSANWPTLVINYTPNPAIIAADTPTAVITEASAVTVKFTANDTPTAVLTESRTLAVSVTRTDTPAASLADLAAIVNRFSAADVPACGIADASATTLLFSKSDTATIAASEVSATLALLSRSDTAALSLAEAIAAFVTVARGDTLQIASFIGAAFGPLAFTGSTESVGVSLADVGTLGATWYAAGGVFVLPDHRLHFTIG